MTENKLVDLNGLARYNEHIKSEINDIGSKINNTESKLEGYLPLTGGTLTGKLTVNANLQVNNELEVPYNVTLGDSVYRVLLIGSIRMNVTNSSLAVYGGNNPDKQYVGGQFQIDEYGDLKWHLSGAITFPNSENCIAFRQCSYGVYYDPSIYIGDINSDTFAEYTKKGIYLSGKTTSDLLNGAGSTTSIDEIKTQVQAAIVDSAPETLDTLNELAAALGDDPNFATTIATQIGNKQDTLVSGANIKTIGGESILGGGNFEVASSSDIQALFN